MSERTHSTPPAAAPRKKLFPLLAGTGAAVLIAGVAFQIFQAEPAASQTREPAPAGNAQPGTATVNGTAASETGSVVARVNNQPITYDIVAKECYDRHAHEVLENIINRAIIHQACQEKGVGVTDAEIQQEVHTIAKKFNLPTATWYQMLESERGITRTQYHRDVIWPMLALKKLAGTDVQVTENELQKAFIRDFGPRVEARMIVIDGNVRHATQVWEQANGDPESFATLAQQNSADPNSRALGGAVPPIRRYGAPEGTPQENVEIQAFKMQPGEVSPVLQLGENRFVILKCEKRTDPVVTDIEQVRAELEAQLVEEKTQLAVAAVFEQIKEKAQVHNFLTGESTAGAAAGVVRTGGTQAEAPAVRTATGAQPTGR